MYIVYIVKKPNKLVDDITDHNKKDNSPSTIPKHWSSPPGFSGACVAQSVVFCVMFCRSLFALLLFFSLGHCVVCPSAIYGFWLPLRRFQISPKNHKNNKYRNWRHFISVAIFPEAKQTNKCNQTTNTYACS
jgi:hypothetical protein